jgi:hypothetical protein
MGQLGSTAVVRNVPTVDTAIHAAGDVIATFNIAPVDGLTGGAVLKQVACFDDSGQADTFTVLFFDGALTGTYTLNGAPAPSAADKLLLLGAVTFVAADWKTAGGDSYGCHECALGLRHTPTQPGNQGVPTTPGALTVVVLAGATPTYAALALKFAFAFLPDGA